MRVLGIVKGYVRGVDRVNRVVGHFAMYLIFIMLGILLLSSVTRTFFNLSYIWIVEMAQFTMAAYYLLGGGYSMQIDSHARMDLFYSRWGPRTRAAVDAATICFLLFYLVVLLWGGVSSTRYALEYGQTNYSSWAPPLAPIKIIMCTGIILMMLQALAMFFKDLARALGAPIDAPPPDTSGAPAGAGGSA